MAGGNYAMEIRWLEIRFARRGSRSRVNLIALVLAIGAPSIALSIFDALQHDRDVGARISFQLLLMVATLAWAWNLGGRLNAVAIGGDASCETDPVELVGVSAKGPVNLIASELGSVFWLTGPDGRQLLYVTPSCEQMWGTPAEVLYRNPLALLEGVHPEDRERVARAITQGSDGSPLEYRVVRADGSVR